MRVIGLVIADGVDACLLDRIGCREIRLADRQIDRIGIIRHLVGELADPRKYNRFRPFVN